MKNSKFEALSSGFRFLSSENEYPRLAGQYQNSNFPNLKPSNNLNFGHLNLSWVFILEIRNCR
jgi:hypothetical protein